MTFSEAISDGFNRYVDFSGRSSRSAYWYWVLFAFLVSLGASVLDQIIGTGFVIGGLLSLALFLPGLAVLVRRLHDVGRSGWWVLILLLPLIGFIVILVFALTESQPPNEWGPAPDTSPTPA